ncbi:MAG: hypothetical protein U1E36_04285 [Rickettsiales bacterium]
MDSALRARAAANQSSPDAEKARLAEMLGGKKLAPNVTVEKVYAAIAKAREESATYYPNDPLPWPVWTDQVKTEAAYFDYGDGTETVFMNPSLLTNSTVMQIAAVFVHEGGHDIRNDKGDSNKEKECAADHFAINIGYDEPLASQLKKYLANAPADYKPYLQNRVNALTNPVYRDNYDDELTFSPTCIPDLKNKDGKGKG